MDLEFSIFTLRTIINNFKIRYKKHNDFNYFCMFRYLLILHNELFKVLDIRCRLGYVRSDILILHNHNNNESNTVIHIHDIYTILYLDDNVVISTGTYIISTGKGTRCRRGSCPPSRK